MTESATPFPASFRQSRQLTATVGRKPGGAYWPAGTATAQSGDRSVPWPDEQTVHVWAVPLDTPPPSSQVLETCLSSSELERAGRFRHIAGRQRFTISRSALRGILASYLTVAPAAVEFAAGPWGKPTLTGAAAAAGLHFNLSHSHELALVAVAWQRPVGVDIEHRRPLPGATRLAARFFSPPEQAAVASAADANEAADTFLRCWTRKEAYIKALGVGVFHDLAGLAVTCLPKEPPALAWCRADPDAPQRWSLSAPDVGQDYIAAIATPGPCRLQQRTWFPAADPEDSPAWKEA